MKLLRFFLKLVLYVVMTFAFVVIFEHGLQNAPANFVSEFFTLKGEIEASLSHK